jgi:hypothetical protein
MQVQFTLKETWSQSFQHTTYVWQTWEDWMHKQLQNAPEGLKTGFQTGDVRPSAFLAVSSASLHREKGGQRLRLCECF